MTKNILLATSDMFLRSSVFAVVSASSHYNLNFACDFDSALHAILHETVDLIIAHQNLGGLTATDLMSVVHRIKPELPFILFDDDISARTAMAAFRLGARDYMTVPPKPHLLLMQIDRCFRLNHNLIETQEAPRVSKEKVDYAALLDPDQRAITLVLTRQQHVALHEHLDTLAQQLGANFVGVLDNQDNVVDAVGELAVLDVRKLRQVVGLDAQSNQQLADVLGIDHFVATFWEGDMYHVYMMTLQKDRASLVAILPASVKAGAVWLQLKRSAKFIIKLLMRKKQLLQPIFT